MSLPEREPSDHDDRFISPPRDELDRLRTPLNEGEWRVFRFLDEFLEPEWEIYVQPALNGLSPDFVVLHPGRGIAVIEVKDWDFSAVSYRIDHSRERPVLKGKRAGEEFALRGIKDPFLRTLQYRAEVANLYCPTLASGGIAAVTGCVVFPRATTAQLQELFGAYHRRLAGNDQRLFPYWRLAGGDLLSGSGLGQVLPVATRSSSNLMTEEVAADLRHWLIEPEFSAEQREPPRLTAKQRELIAGQGARRQRVRGPAGSGKSVAISGRAARLADEDKRTLVLTFNITLLNYLRDLTSAFGASANHVEWLNFHWWLRRCARQ